MNLFSRVLSAFGLGGLRNPEKGAQSSGPSSRGSDAGITVSDERALQLSAVWACSRIITQTVAGLPLHFYEKVSGGGQQLADDPIALLFRRSPNNFMTPKQFRAAMTLQRVLWGNAYAKKTFVGSRVAQLTPMRPECMTPYLTETGLQYHYNTGHGVRVYSPESIFHLKGFSVDGIVGLSTLAYSRHVLGTTLSADTYAAKAFANGGMPMGQITFDQFLTAEQRDQARSLYRNFHASVSQAGDPVIMEGGAKFAAVGIHPDDMQMLQSRTFQISEIARIFGVPNHMINDSEKATTWGSGIEQQTIAFLQYTIKPYLDEWEDVIWSCLLKDKPDVYASHNVEGLLRGDSTSRAAFLSKMTGSGIMTANEARAKENMLPLDGGDELRFPVNLMPAVDAGQGGQNVA